MENSTSIDLYYEDLGSGPPVVLFTMASKRGIMEKQTATSLPPVTE